MIASCSGVVILDNTEIELKSLRPNLSNTSPEINIILQRHCCVISL